MLRKNIAQKIARRRHRQRRLPKSPASPRMSVCLQRHPATDLCQIQCSRTVRWVRPQGSCKVRNSSAACHWCCWKACACLIKCNMQAHCARQPFVHLHLVGRRISNYSQFSAVCSRSYVHDCCHHTVRTSGHDNFVMCPDVDAPLAGSRVSSTWALLIVSATSTEGVDMPWK